MIFLIKLKGYLKPFIGGISLSFVLLFVQAVCELNLPNYMSEIVNVGIQQNQSDAILRIGALMLLFTLISGIAAVLVSLISSRIAAGVAQNLRMDIFSRIESFALQEFDKFSTASLITRTTNDVTQIQTLLMMGIRILCYAPIMAVGGIFMALNKSSSMAWLIAGACFALFCLIMAVFFLVVPRFKKMQGLIDRLNLVARETLNGLMVVRAFGRGDFEKKRFGLANKDLADVNLFVNRTTAFLMPTMMLVMNALTLLIIWVGAHQVAQSSILVGDMIAFMQYAILIISAFLMIYMMFIFIPRAAVSAARIAEVLETVPSITDPASPKSMSADKRGVVEFSGVSFRYEGAQEDVLSDISFTAKPGETVAFIGATGSGKSTLANLIMRFYDVSEGEVKVGGVDVRELAQKDLRAAIGYVPQRSILMSGTIESNIRYGNDGLTLAELEEIATVAQAKEFISQKEEGFASKIAQSGANLSGGQRQRLSIARALAVKPDIFIFDDSFSALDFKTDAALRKALKAYTHSSTVIIVAQRVSTIMNAEQIFVIDNGRILASGTHKSLLKSCPEYHEIALSQFSEEELNNE